MSKVNVFNLDGSVKGKVELPRVFSAAVRTDLIQRAVLALQSARRQAYGSDYFAGKRTAAHYYGVKDKRGSMKNREVARGPRVTGGSPGQEWTVKFVPHARGGRAPHPPLTEKGWTLKMNSTENRLATASAIAATALREFVTARGHRTGNTELPLIVSNDIESVGKAKQLSIILAKLGLEEELERASVKNIRAGKGKMRGRKYKKKVGPLIVIAADKGIGRAAANIPGAAVSTVAGLNAEILAPGAHAGRLTIWSEGAMAKLEERFG